MHDLEHALQRLVVLVGMQLGDLGPRDELAREPRVVLHRAGAEEADAHHPERLLREVQVVAQDLGLRQLRQLRAARRGAAPSGTSVGRVADRVASTSGSTSAKTTPRRPGRAHLHHERLVPDGRVVAAERHASTSSSAATSRSMSAWRVHLGDAVERALSELREVAREVLAAEDPARAQRRVDLGDRPARLVEVDDELLEEAARGRRIRTPSSSPEPPGGVVAALRRSARPSSAKPSGPISAM